MAASSVSGASRACPEDRPRSGPMGAKGVAFAGNPRPASTKVRPRAPLAVAFSFHNVE